MQLVVEDGDRGLDLEVPVEDGPPLDRVGQGLEVVGGIVALALLEVAMPGLLLVPLTRWTLCGMLT